jgi:hypothetical protein
VLVAAEKYEVDYLVLEKNHPPQLKAVYQNPEAYPQLTYLGTTAEIHFFSLKERVTDE